MKVLKNKLKKVHIIKRFFYFLSLLIYLATFIFFVINVIKLSGIETVIRYIIIVFFGIWLLIYILTGLLTMISKKTKTFIFITLITLIFSAGFGGISYYINKGYSALAGMNNAKLVYTSNLIALKETTFSDGLTIGMIDSENDIEGNILAKKLIEKESLSNKIETYEDYHSMISDLYKGKIGACFVSSNFAITFANETFENLKEGETSLPIGERVKVLFEFSEERENQDNQVLKTKPTKKLTEPFSILVMGVDSTIDGLKVNQAFNGDTLILVTFNPSTLTATMFSIPRDLYVPIACNHNRYAKINSSAAYGSSCVINTVQQLTDVDIDYYVKINFIGVVKLVEALNGVTVNVQEPDFRYNAGVDCGVQDGKKRVCEQNSLRQFGKNMVYIPSGTQTLNGEQALAYSRNRHQYATSDIARNQHQQDVIVAMAQKLRETNSLKDFENILNTVSSNIETNMTPEQILSFYDVGKNMLLNSTGNALSIKKTYLSYYSLPVWLPRSEMYTSALGYYPESLEAITKLMKVNLGIEKSNEKPIKTFSISYNEEYTTPVVGKGLTGGSTLKRVQSFIGETRLSANSWCSQVGIKCNFETVKNSASEGIIVDQSEHEGVLIKSISSITFKVSDGKGKSEENEDNDKTVKSFIGNSRAAAKTWCDKNDIECTFEEVTDEAPEGVIVAQSVKKGTSLEEVKSITFKYSDGKGKTGEKPDDPEKPNEEDPKPPVTSDPVETEPDKPTPIEPDIPKPEPNTTE